MKIIKNNIFTNKNIGLKILVLSDLHIYDKKSLNKLNKIKEYLNKKQYDVVCLVGDIIDSTNVLSENNEIYIKLLDFIKYLGNYTKTYIVYGSHDISYRDYKKMKWMDDYETFKKYFLNVVSKYEGVKILENETVIINNNYTISGFNPSFNYAYSKNKEDVLIKESRLNFLNKLDKNKTNILLCHYPDAVRSLINTNYLDNVDIAISGHNHNGMTQLKIFPFESVLNIFKQNNRGIITPSKSFKLSDTKILRGNVQLSNRTRLIINPSITSLSNCTNILHNFDGLFYSGATEINFIPAKGLDN